MQTKHRKQISATPKPPAPQAERQWRLGVELAAAGDWLRAEQAFQQAVRRRPSDQVYLLNLARAQMKNERLEEAIRNSQAVLEMAPEDTTARNIVARCLSLRHRDAEAVECLRAQPAHLTKTAEYHQTLGEALFKAGRYQEAIGALFDALAGDIAHAMSHYRLGLSFNRLSMKREATECLRTALVIGMNGGTLATQGMLTFIERELCRWDHADEDLAALRRIAASLPVDAAQWGTVFAQVVLTDDGLEKLRVARSCVGFNTLKITPFALVAPRVLPQRLRVAFASSDLHHHATAMLMVEVFEKLDRDRFEVSLYSYGQDDGSEMRQRLIRAADHFIDASRMSDLEIAEAVRAADTELLIDLKGHTGDSRPNIMAYKAAPVQVSYLGFPGPTGSDQIDYVIGDEIVTPLAHADHFSEKIALLPRCYQPNDRKRPLPAPMTRAEVGLPEDALVLCGFNQPFKLSPEVFDVWCRLLRQLPHAVLWLLQWNETAPALLRAEAAKRGIAPERLVFVPKVDIGEHLSRFALADLFIDSWPCNGHTTASDALWAGVPVVTFAGETFVSRVAASLLHGVGLPELVCSSTADYERLVLELAADAPRRDTLRAHLVAARDTAPLFDSDGYARDFGNLLWTMAERWSRGLAPDHLPPAHPNGRGAS